MRVGALHTNKLRSALHTVLFYTKSNTIAHFSLKDVCAAVTGPSNILVLVVVETPGLSETPPTCRGTVCVSSLSPTPNATSQKKRHNLTDDFARMHIPSMAIARFIYQASTNHTRDRKSISTGDTTGVGVIFCLARHVFLTGGGSRYIEELRPFISLQHCLCSINTCYSLYTLPRVIGFHCCQFF